MRRLCRLLFAMSLALFASACSDSNPSAPVANDPHPDGWVLTHGAEATNDPTGCALCHGLDLTGSGTAVSCFTCHIEGFALSIHPTTWGEETVAEHQHFYNTDLISWTECASPACHGTDLRGGSGSGKTGPSCFSFNFTNSAGTLSSCHDPGSDPPGAPSPSHRLPFLDPGLHGGGATDATSIGESMLVCRNCHGRPPYSFDGGFVTAFVEPVDTNCSASTCHPAAKAHPTNWQGSNDPDTTFFATHRTVSQKTVDESCSLCHNTVMAGPGPLAGAPSCFTTSFSNSDGSATSCHSGGPAGAPHAVPFTDPNLHGPAAKADLTFCQNCHAAPGGAGSNPRFNVAIGSLVSGCEDCHDPGTAHPTTDDWTFFSDPMSTRRTHFAAGNVLAACALCHGAALGGGVGPTCFSCHVSAPLFRLVCNYCHGNPPPGGIRGVPGATVVNHSLVPLDAASHNACARCHGANDDGSGKLTDAGPDYVLFDKLDPSLQQGGDHLDGNIEMNGPHPITGAGYDDGNFGCDNACHPNAPPYQLSDSALPVEFGNYGTGEPRCDTCHGYPPTESTPDTTGATVVDHDLGRNDGGAVLLAAHNDCITCHGNKDDGTGSHSPLLPYTVAGDHQDGNIEMNGPTGTGAGYNSANFGCDNACHPNDAAHRLTDSTLPVEFDDYGGGGGAGACASCHDTGVNGAPIVISNVTPHAGAFTCEGCHTGHNAGTVEIPNNPAVGIDYTANGEGGIALGGIDAPGASEAEICWACHDNFTISEWGANSQGSTGNSNYDYGRIFADAGASIVTSNWIGAFWKSATPAFAYKTGQVRSTHSANAAATAAGVDTAGSIRCSYCHDVHELALAPADTAAGPPYLRGTWRGNPYPEDGAPQLTSTYQNILSDHFGSVPRGSTAHNETGGFQIDQNNSNPTQGLTADATSGLCELCHGNGNGSWTTGEIDNLNQFGNTSLAWVGDNGHSNAVLGGSGSLASNIFNTGDRHTSAIVSGVNGAGNPTMAYQHVRPTSDRAFGFRNTNLNGEEGWNLAPRMWGNSNERPRGFDFYDWGATVNSGTTDSQYHRFTCSKCHNPHASRLPRLMITNCLDTKHNAWDDRGDVDSLPTTPSSAGTAISQENAGVTFSNATSAQNCHRLKDPQFPNSRGSGWNHVTPWTGVNGPPDNPDIQ